MIESLAQILVGVTIGIPIGYFLRGVTGKIIHATKTD